ncbi:Oidioi.mRNA.OKI2018_I69.XSR.g16843.t1.cds [Oikopleura dioica]|uniref:Oidioi.mRNA.OKI2018_I69.XSR.g16843.t1.cds n=1 Tax=Oikopleura dioica TaxID=34765 RepID=A0ABN7SHW2_OIKDI|nr:Oidioi.mRNA.OKI2018_I69.XSR.g16843.t1.cds [Oikopleura dioica]
MCLHNRAPTAIGGGNDSDRYSKKTETLGLGGWTVIEDFPKKVNWVGCMTINDDLITVGGRTLVNDEIIYLNDVYVLKNQKWFTAGKLKEVTMLNALIHFGDYFFSFSGNISPFAVEKAFGMVLM